MDDRLPRKLAVILHADVVGYSRLASKDEDTTHLQLKISLDRISALVDTYHGRVVNKAGDAVLAMFEAVVDGVSCAMAIQHDMAKINRDIPDDRKVLFRIGVNLGDVIEDGGDIFGDGVNVAARLEGLADPGCICISEQVYMAVKGKIEIETTDLGSQEVKNIDEPVRAYQIERGKGIAPPRPSERRESRERGSTGAKRLTVPLLVAAVILIGVVLAWMQPWRDGGTPTALQEAEYTLPDRPSIAVLPFDNLSNDPEQEYFADGVTEDIITALSRFGELFVIARNSTFSYKGKSVDVRQIGKELGAAYLVEGSVRRENNRLKINAQLIDVNTGSHIWAEKFDKEFQDVFEIRDDITRSITGRLVPEITRAGTERIRNTPTDDMDAWDLYLQSSAAYSEFTKDSLVAAISNAEAAIERDPNFSAPHAVIARSKGWQYFYGWTEDSEQTLAEAIESAETAVRLDSTDASGYSALGYLHRFHRNESLAVSNLERAVELNPNDASIRLELGHVLDWFRLQERALPQILEAIKLSPRDPRLQMMLFFKSHILFHLGEFEASLEASQQMSSTITSKLWQVNYHLVRAANLAELGRSEEAKTEIASAREINPKLSIAFIQNLFAIANNHPGNRAAWLASLEKAGMPLE